MSFENTLFVLPFPYRGLIVLDILREAIEIVSAIINLVSRRYRAPTRGGVLGVTEPQEDVQLASAVVVGTFVLLVGTLREEADSSATLFAHLPRLLRVDDLSCSQLREGDSLGTGDHPDENVRQAMLRLIGQESWFNDEMLD